MTYNARGQVKAVIYGNGAVTAYAYDDVASSFQSVTNYIPWHRGMLRSVTATDSSGVVRLKQSYNYFWTGRIAGIDDQTPANTGDWSYGYDGLWRLISATNTGTAGNTRLFSYNDADSMTRNSGLCAMNPNITYATASIVGRVAVTGAGGPHAPSSICGVAPAYDKNGNTLSYDGDGTGAAVLPRL
jgi:hypothetical protein